MSQKTQDALIGALVMALLVGAALGAYALGAVEIAAMLAGAGAGYLAPRGVPRTSSAAALLLAVAMAGALASGCGTWADTARHTLESAARITDAADLTHAAMVRADCGQFAGDADAVDACLAEHGYDDGSDAIRSADATLRSGQATIDAAEHMTTPDDPAQVAACDLDSDGDCDGDDGRMRWERAWPCVAAAVVEVYDAVAGLAGTDQSIDALAGLIRPAAAACVPPGGE